MVSSNYYNIIVIWGISNGNYTYNDMSSNNDGINLVIAELSATKIFAFKDQVNDNEDTGTWLENTTYYFTIKRATTTGTVKIYSDETRLILLDTLTIVTTENTYQYIIPFGSYDHATRTNTFTGTIEDLDLQEVTPPVTTDKNIPNYFKSKFITNH